MAAVRDRIPQREGHSLLHVSQADHVYAAEHHQEFCASEQMGGSFEEATRSGGGKSSETPDERRTGTALQRSAPSNRDANKGAGSDRRCLGGKIRWQIRLTRTEDHSRYIAYGGS
ncbi:hypothetical protein LCGC14_0450910 [marine sediment metagenome]|uniref:Uncharacterized protein n=1 Tax=marine sediment metagenome TaxID=412755 RepID=A0A0F9SHQ2_9ZZZZ